MDMSRQGRDKAGNESYDQLSLKKWLHGGPRFINNFTLEKSTQRAAVVSVQMESFSAHLTRLFTKHQKVKV